MSSRRNSLKKSLTPKNTPSKKTIPKIEDSSSSSGEEENFYDRITGQPTEIINSSSESDSESPESEEMKWGSRRSDYYGQPRAEDEETQKKINERLQKQAKQSASTLRTEDFDDMPKKKKAAAHETQPKPESVDFKLEVNYDHMTPDEKIDLLKEEFPQLIELIKDFQEKAKEIRENIEPILQMAKERKLRTGGISFLELKYQLLLSYLMHLNYYFILKISGQSIVDHPVIQELARIRVIMERMKPIDVKLQNQIDSLVRIASMGETAQPSNMRHRPNLDAFDSDSEDDQPNQNDKYIVAKSSANPFMEEKAQKKEAKRIARLKSKISKSSMMKHLQTQYTDTPEERPQVGATFDEEEDQDEKERQKFEEDYFVRLPTKKKVLKQKQHKLQSNANFFDTLPSYNQIMVLDKLGKKQIQQKSEKMPDTEEMLRQRFGAIPESRELEFDAQDVIKQNQKKRKVEYDSIAPEERRKLSKDILNDRGFVKNRSKDTKNSKTKLRKKYSNAVAKRSSTVRPMKSQNSAYSGETRISTHVVRSKNL